MASLVFAHLQSSSPSLNPRLSLRATHPTSVTQLHEFTLDAEPVASLLGGWWQHENVTTLCAKQLKKGIVQIHDFLAADVASELAKELSECNEWDKFEEHRCPLPHMNHRCTNGYLMHGFG